MKNKIQFVFNDQIQTLEFDENLKPTTTVLEYLRKIRKTGTKEGCAEGDCGACTVVIAEIEENKLTYRALNSCVMFLPSLHGKQLITIENLEDSQHLHPIQVAIIENHASQCGFCTPGFTMSLFAQLKQKPNSTYEDLIDAITGNLCRCTGYKSIDQAAHSLVGKKITDRFTKNEKNIINLLNQIKTDQPIIIETSSNLYLIPFNISQALELKNKYPKAIIANGGTDLVLSITKKKQHIPIILDISMVKELQQIENKGDIFFIGAGVKIERLREYSIDIFPELANFLSDFGAKQIRNSASVGGNIGTASPVSDLAMAFMAMDAEVILISENGQRIVPIDKFIIGYRKTDIKPNELIKGFYLKKTTSNQIIKLFKISKRKKLDISTVNAGFNLILDNNKVKDIRIIYGGMAEMIKHAEATEKFLKNKNLSEQLINQAAEIVAKEFTPIDDARSSAQARTIMAKNLLIKFYQSIN